MVADTQPVILDEENEENIHTLYANIGKVIVSAVNIDDIVEGVMHEVEVYFHPEHWSLIRLDETTNELFFVSIRGTDFDKVKDIRLKLGEGIAGTVALTRKSRFVPDTSKDPSFSTKVDDSIGFVTKSIIAVPLVFHDKVYGVLEVINKAGGGNYTEKEHTVLKTIADFSAIAFYNAGLFEQMESLATRDSLTGAYNRAKLNLDIDQRNNEKERRSEDETHLFSAVFMIDLNKFKPINDKFGHRAGDKVLQNIVTRLQQVTREEDKVFRIGGDEFLILIDVPDEDSAQKAIVRIDAALQQVKEKTNRAKVPYCFSWGHASGSRHKLEELIHDADLSMYNKKTEKRTSR